MKTFLATASLSVLITAVHPAAAVDTAEIHYLVGEVHLKKGAQWKTARAGTVVEPGTSLVTGARGLVIMRIGKDTLIKVYPDTTFTWDGPGEASPGGLVTLTGGTLFLKFMKAGKNSPPVIRHRSIVASIRGTHYYAAVKRNSVLGNDYWLCVNEGTVHLLDNASGTEATIRAGEGVLVKNAKKITAPRRYTWTEGLNWNMDPARGPVEEKKGSRLYGEDGE